MGHYTVRDGAYWDRVRRKADELNADGCSGVTEAYHDCCLEHDIAYRTHHTVDGIPQTRSEADAQFRTCMQERSRFGKYSPMSWWRWVGVRLLGRSAYGKGAK